MQIGDGQGALKSRYNLRERCYIGNTTMDPELAFIQANLAGVRPDELVLDPFCGTGREARARNTCHLPGGLLLAAAEFGAFVMGTEINYQIALGIGDYREAPASC